MGCYARDLCGSEPQSLMTTGDSRPGATVETLVEAIATLGEGRRP
jgi:hypothetical protein